MDYKMLDFGVVLGLNLDSMKWVLGSRFGCVQCVVFFGGILCVCVCVCFLGGILGSFCADLD